MLLCHSLRASQTQSVVEPAWFARTRALHVPGVKATRRKEYENACVWLLCCPVDSPHASKDPEGQSVAPTVVGGDNLLRILPRFSALVVRPRRPEHQHDPPPERQFHEQLFVQHHHQRPSGCRRHAIRIWGGVFSREPWPLSHPPTRAEVLWLPLARLGSP